MRYMLEEHDAQSDNADQLTLGVSEVVDRWGMTFVGRSCWPFIHERALSQACQLTKERQELDKFQPS